MNSIKQFNCEKRTWTKTRLLHTHEFGQLIFPLQGALVLETKHQSLTINDSALFYLPPGCTHAFFSQQEVTECLVVDIPIFIASNIIKLNIEHDVDNGIFLKLDAAWQALRFLILTETDRKDPAFNYLIYYSFRLLKEKQEYPSLLYIHNHYFETIPMNILAELEHYNVTYYGQWFKKKMGITPQQYIQKIRLEEAKRLMRETDFSILDIAQQVGYTYQSYLTRLFKEAEGMTPQQYKIYNRYK
jgi:AraC-like DNA-binding protein